MSLIQGEKREEKVGKNNKKGGTSQITKRVKLVRVIKYFIYLLINQLINNEYLFSYLLNYMII